MKKTLPQSMAWLHSWAGVIFGWVLFAIALTGTISVFKPEVFGWMHPEARKSNATIPAIVAAVDYLEAHADTSRPWRLFAPDDRSITTRAFYYTRDPQQTADAKPKLTYHDRALDAVTGRPDGIRHTKGGEFFYRFHFQLDLPHPYGRVLAVLAGVAMLVAIISGVLTHRRIFTDFFVFRPGPTKRNWLDAHNVMAVFALPFHLVITFSGILTLVTLMFPWALMANYGDNNELMEAELDPGHVHRPALKEPAPLGDMAAMLKHAEAEFDGGRIGRVSIENPGDKNALVMVEQHDGDNVAYRTQQITFDGVTGEVLKVYREEQTARRIYDTIYGLHLTRFASGVSRWLYFISGLLLSALIATGLIIWSLSRADHETFVRRAVARLTAGTTMGLIMAVPVFFWANRLLPASDPMRAQTEVQWFYITWFAGVAWALVRHPRSAWAEQAAAAAVLYTALPIASAALTGRGLWAQGLSDPMFTTFDLVLTITGVMFASIAVILKRRSNAVPSFNPALAS